MGLNAKQRKCAHSNCKICSDKLKRHLAHFAPKKKKKKTPSPNKLKTLSPNPCLLSPNLKGWSLHAFTTL